MITHIVRGPASFGPMRGGEGLHDGYAALSIAKITTSEHRRPSSWQAADAARKLEIALEPERRKGRADRRQQSPRHGNRRQDAGRREGDG